MGGEVVMVMGKMGIGLGIEMRLRRIGTRL